MSYEYDDAYEIYEEIDRFAKKPTVCSACSETIKIGSHYTRIHILFNEKYTNLNRCNRCQAIHMHLRELPGDSQIWPREKLDCGLDYKEEWGKEPPADVAALAFALPGDVNP